MKYGIHWFRRDLRLVGNSALEKNLERHEGRVLGVFCFDKKFLARPDFSWNRFTFFLKTLQKLREEIRSQGGELIFLDEGPKATFPMILDDLKKSKQGLPDLISWNRDYEPFAIARDADLYELFTDVYKINTHTERDHLLIEPSELQKDSDSSFYQVYTPFSNRWMKIFATDEINHRLREVGQYLKKGPSVWKKVLSDEQFKWAKTSIFENYLRDCENNCNIPLPEVGFEAAKKILKNFKTQALENYGVDRDIPSVVGTSHMSIYLKNGSITVPQIIGLLKLTPQSKDSEFKYFKELIWREFYYHILFHAPRVEHEPFLKKYQKLKWQNDKKLFKAWCEGKTGYPIVDAGMRQLNQTGWMHNRVRMIVASFLTKDLLIDYRWGEKYFMDKLLDGDLAPNNGGWQWAASTGCDPQPYFRIFNPTSQSEKFDPEGAYIRKWVPERRQLNNKEIHLPIDPIVDHATQRDLALEMYKDARN
jgi:deoxyribodipyrimidine photo-lyase